MKSKYLRFLSLTVIIALLFSGCRNNSQKKTDYAESIAATDSIEILNQAIRENSSNVKLWEERAQLYLKKGNIDYAFRDLNKALDLDAQNASLYILLSDLYFTIGKSQEALTALKKAIDLDHTNPNYYLKLARFSMILEQYDKAFRYAQQALSYNAELPEAFYIQAISKLEQHDTTGALTLMKVAANMDSNFFAANLNIAVILDKRHDSAAASYYLKAVRLKPANVLARYSLAMFYQQRHAFDKALEQYAKIVKNHPDHAQSYFNTGYIYLTEKLDFNKAAEAFTKAVEIKPDYTEAVYNLGRTYEAMGKLDLAKQKYREALKLTTNYPLAIEGLNRIEK